MQIADRNAFRQQQFERLEAGIRKLAEGMISSTSLRYSGSDRSTNRRMSPVGQELRQVSRMTSRKCVSMTDMGSIGLKPSRLTLLANISAIQTAFMPNAGSRPSSNGTSGTGPSPVITSSVADSQLFRGHDRSVNLDLVGLRRDSDVVGDLDFGNNEPVLLRKGPPHARHAVRQLAMRGQRDVDNCLPRQISTSAVLSCSLTDWRDSSSRLAFRLPPRLLLPRP